MNNTNNHFFLNKNMQFVQDMELIFFIYNEDTYKYVCLVFHKRKELKTRHDQNGLDIMAEHFILKITENKTITKQTKNYRLGKHN